MRRAAEALRRAVHDGDDLDARTDMAIASLCGGLALANAAFERGFSFDWLTESAHIHCFRNPRQPR